MAASQKGEITIFDKTGKELHSINLKCNLESAALYPENELIAYTTKTELIVCNYTKEIVFREKGRFEGLFFSNHLFWVVYKENQDKVCLRVYDWITWQPASTLDFEDIYGDSSYMISAGATENDIVLWMAAGQDGQCSFFVTLKNNKLEAIQLEYEDTLPPVFNGDGSEFFISDDESLTIFGYPNMKAKKSYSFPDSYRFTESSFYINSLNIALIGEDGFHLLETHQKKFKDIIIQGHEPKPTSFYYPKLDDEDGELVTDFAFAQIFGDHILISCRNSQLTKERHSVLILNKNQIE
jgi:hypothetical protein